MRRFTRLIAALAWASPVMAQQAITPGSPSLRPDRIQPYTDTIALVLAPRDSAPRPVATLVRRVQRVESDGTPIFRETQHYVFASGEETDTLDVSAATLAPLRVVENGAKTRHTLRLDGGRLIGTAWSSDSGQRRIDAPLAKPFFHGMMTESFIAALPLAPGAVVRLPVAETPNPTVRVAEFRVTGTDTLHTAFGSVECLVVQESKATVAWVSKADGHLVRLHWVLPDGTGIWKLPAGDVSFIPDRVGVS